MKRWLLFTLALTINAMSWGQGGFDDKNPLSFQRQIKQLDEFILRFNRDVVPDGMDSTSDNVHKKTLMTLFDFEYAENRENEVLNFINSVILNNERLSYRDTGWYALASCHATLDKKPTTVMLVLKVEYIDSIMYKWVIHSAFGDELSLTPYKKSKMRKLFPLENEVNFMQLSTITSRDQENIMNYCAKGFELDQTTVFFTLVASKRLHIDYVEDLSYQLQTQEYLFWIKFFARETTNSGWLIYNIKRK